MREEERLKLAEFILRWEKHLPQAADECLSKEELLSLSDVALIFHYNWLDAVLRCKW